MVHTFDENTIISVHRAFLGLTTTGKGHRTFSCYDIKVIEKYLLEQDYTFEKIEGILDWFYDNCTLITKGVRRKCDCWIKNETCFCATGIITPDKPDKSQLALEF